MQQPPKRPPSKKRHTKPCRFFQTARCPLSAQDCDFAHVLSNEVTFQSPNPCRYYAVGKCGNGTRCRYRHDVEYSGGSDVRSSHMREVGSPSEQDSFHQYQFPRMFRQGTWDGQGVRSEITSSFSMPPQGTYQLPSNKHDESQFFPISPIVLSPETPTQQLCQPDLISPTHSGGSSTMSTSVCSSLSDDILFVTGDPKYDEHHHSYQSQVRVADDLPPIHVPPFYSSSNVHAPMLTIDPAYSTIHTPMYGSYSSQHPISPGSSTPSRPRSQHASRNKVVNYKTKPCRFYIVNKTCPNGDECTFIHNEAERNSDPNSQGQRFQSGLPQKPMSRKEENKNKNFFPISWRVIGGGVLMGEAKPPISRDAAAPVEPSEPTEPMKEEVPECADPTSEEAAPAIKRTASRGRSTSIPPTPSATHFKVETLFSAESPGGL